MAADGAKNLVIKEYWADISVILIIGASFDYSWKNRGWNASRVILFTMVEVFLEVLDISDKC